MSNLQAIVERDIVVTSNMMLHSGDTKFYEVLLLQSQPSDMFSPLCITRWGTINKQERGGAWGKGKLLSAHRPESYAAAIVRDKSNNGYTIHGSTRRANSPCYDYLLRLGFFDLWGEDNASVINFLKQFGIDCLVGVGVLPIGVLPMGTMTSTPIITRSPLYGSWS